MSPSIVVLGAGYAGAAAITRLEQYVDDANLVWVSREPYHFVLHEGHRVIGDRAAANVLTIPVSEIISPETTFVRGVVTGLDTADGTLILEGNSAVNYDYLVVAIGSTTAFYGIPGVGENAFTLKSRTDALRIADRIATIREAANPHDPARVVIGGAGLSGVQIAGEIAELRDRYQTPIDIRILEARNRPLPDEDRELSRCVGRNLDARDIDCTTGHPVVAADDESVEAEGIGTVTYDFFVWTGGVTGRKAVTDGGAATVDSRLVAEASAQSSHPEVFVAGDAAFVDGGRRVPPTAQAAWQAGKTVADNVVSSIRGRQLTPFQYRDRGTLLSIGDAAIAHAIPGIPRRTFGGFPAQVLKKGAAARWITSIASAHHAARAWRYL